MCDKIVIIDCQHRENIVAKDEMLVALATVSLAISNPGMAFKIVCLC